jgi:hypothetical protein
MRSVGLPGVVIKHLFHVAMICCDQAVRVFASGGFNYFAQAIIETFHCPDGGRHDTGMAHHIPISKITDDEIVFICLDTV